MPSHPLSKAATAFIFERLFEARLFGIKMVNVQAQTKLIGQFYRRKKSVARHSILRGESSSRARVSTAMIGKTSMCRLSTMTCAGCHGARGEGKTEGGVTAGNLTWTNLTKPYGQLTTEGENTQAFSEASSRFAR